MVFSKSLNNKLTGNRRPLEARKTIPMVKNFDNWCSYAVCPCTSYEIISMSNISESLALKIDCRRATPCRLHLPLNATPNIVSPRYCDIDIIGLLVCPTRFQTQTNQLSQWRKFPYDQNNKVFILLYFDVIVLK